MIYTQHDKLTCYTMQDASDQVSFDSLMPLLISRPSNMIYCEKEKKLFGIISMGDIRRSYLCNQKFVTINQQFTCLSPTEYMKARQLFKDHLAINALPVIDNQRHLIAAYSRWDDLISYTDFDNMKQDANAISFWTQVKRIALVKPCDIFKMKKELMSKWYAFLTSMKVHVDIIERTAVSDAFSKYTYILFTDQDELKGTYELYYSFYGRNFLLSQAKTYSEIKQEYVESIIDLMTQYHLSICWSGTF